MKQGKVIILLLFCLTIPALVSGVETAFWQIGTFEDFLRGSLVGVSLSKEGELRLAPEARAVFSPEETLALSLASDQRHNLYVGTGHQGKVFRMDASLKGALFFQAPEPEILALSVGPDGALYVGSSPEGKIYRVTPDGKSTVFYDPKTKYVWALAFDPQGRLYVGTGNRGQILRVDAAGKGQVFFDSSQTHIMCLTFERSGNLLAGSEPNGLIYRIDPQGKAFVLYQASLPEIHALATDAEGRIYAAALGGAGGKGTPEFLVPPGQSSPSPTTVTTVTVRASSGEASTSPNNVQQPPRQSPSAPSLNRTVPPNVAFPLSQLAQGRGSLIQILPDYSAETLWSSNNESVFGLVIRGHDVLFSTDSDGRVFDLSPSPEGSKLTLLTETRESLATRLLLEGTDLYVATSNIAKLFKVGTALSGEGSYESPVKDTKFISRWGVLGWRGEIPPGSSLQFFSRSGNSERPDNTWSDWAGPYRNPDASPILSPPARYIQWKAVFRGSGGASPTLDEVTVSYLNQNLPPQIRSLNVSTAGERTGPAGATSSPSGSSGSGVTVSGVSSTGFGPPPSGGELRARPPVTLSWQADDPNGDPLVYSLYLKAEDEHEWHLLREKLRETSYTLAVDFLADGRYVARLVASDEESNPPDRARKAELVSAPFWIDNSRPRIKVLSQTFSSAGAEVHFQVESSISPLRSAEVSTDGKGWRDLDSDDGIVDSRLETFTVKNLKLEPGEHIISLRAYDTAGNAGVGKAVVRVLPGGGSAR